MSERASTSRRANATGHDALASRLEQQPIRVIVVDDHALVLHGVASLLRSMQGIEVIANVRSADDLLAQLERERPDIVITEVDKPHLDGVALIAKIRERYPGLSVVLSMHRSPHIVQRAVRSGACAYVMKADAPQDLENVLRQVALIGSYFSAEVTRLLLQNCEPRPDERLAPRQLQVLTMMAQGKSSKEIGSDLCISPKTADLHRCRLMRTLGIRSVAGLTLYAVRHGLVQA